MFEVSNRDSDLQRLKDEVENLRQELNALRSSTSWRITTPLRALSRSPAVQNLRATLRDFTLGEPASLERPNEASVHQQPPPSGNHTHPPTDKHVCQNTALPTDFDGPTYLRLHPDVAAAAEDPAGHYLAHGIREGRKYRDSGPAHTPAHTAISERFVQKAPDNQNLLDLFSGAWSSAMPLSTGLKTEPGNAGLFEDARILWANELLGPLNGKTVLELGPLEGGHSYMLQGFGAKVTAIEANSGAFLRCLCVKQVFGLSDVQFLLGDFSKYLERNNQRYDAVIACGVLYHMTNPIQLLRHLVARSDKIFLWTHYYDEKTHSNRPDGHLFRRDANVDRLLDGYRGVRKLYAQEALAWTGFTGGINTHAIWLERPDILRFFADHGYRTKIGFDHVDHPNGPAFAICASRA